MKSTNFSTEQVTDKYLFDLMSRIKDGANIYGVLEMEIYKELEGLGLCKFKKVKDKPVSKYHKGCILTVAGVDVMNYLNPIRTRTKDEVLKSRSEGVTRLICETFNLKLGERQREDMASLIVRAMMNEIEV